MRVDFDKGITVRTAAGLILAFSIGLAGCGGGEPGLNSVRGRVTYKGQPVTQGEIYFTPDKSGARAAQSPLDSDGRYQLGTFAPKDGAYAGSHKISVVSRGPDKPIPAKKAASMLPEDMQGTGDPLIPRKYFSPETSKLSVEVAPGESNTFDFELTD
ncbi:hypothetical protein SAMN05444166_2960 [Singulisphaera sp. GP187]|uniref:hypothetical protein n=1 Tax=Singulisphaera sp. GP187 TaxID=1882752 RepID=UPI00092C132B|nr:hypothetical protein [Singulisphaera sp. GP187]SIO20099.1 hypothetical protein SAMN05444166_2960 [Singulisphaera sp. GP187]